MGRLLLFGGGGHCRSVIDSLLSLNAYDDIGIVDYIESSWLGIDTIGSDEDVPKLIKEGWDSAFITVGSVGNTRIRSRLYKMVKQNGLKVVTIIDPTAVVGSATEIGEGVYIGKRAIVNTGTRIEECAIINTSAIVEHDCTIGAFSHISPGTVLCGQVSVGDDSHVGAGSTVRQQIQIGESTIIGVGSVVVKNIPAHVRAYGNPCKVVE